MIKEIQIYALDWHFKKLPQQLWRNLLGESIIGKYLKQQYQSEQITYNSPSDIA